MLAFSTNWNSSRHEKGASMLREIEVLGFEWIELGHGIKAEALPGILKCLSKTHLKICSVHNYCPQPAGLPHHSCDFLEFTALNTTDRKRAVQKTKETIDLASQLGAQTVILHLGSQLKKAKEEEKLLVRWRDQNKRRKWVASKLRLVNFLECEDVWERIHECLTILMTYAKTKKVKLGIENRAFFSELPADDCEIKFNRYGKEIWGYWHDFGHAQVKENLGWGNHWELFISKKERLLGCHFHDAQFPIQDHQPIRTGRVPWELLLPHVPKEIPWVMEYHPRVSSEQIIKDKNELSVFLNS